MPQWDPSTEEMRSGLWKTMDDRHSSSFTKVVQKVFERPIIHYLATANPNIKKNLPVKGPYKKYSNFCRKQT